MNFNYKKILIIGCGGAGKSTLAVALGKKLDLPVVHLDKLWWKPNWQNRTEDEFDTLLDIELNKPCWIIDGNYSRTFGRRLEFADLCIFLDYTVDVCIKGVRDRVKIFNGKTRPDMTDGCLERIDEKFEEWIVNFQDVTRPKMLSLLQASAIDYKIIKTREDADKWLNNIQI